MLLQLAGKSYRVTFSQPIVPEYLRVHSERKVNERHSHLLLPSIIVVMDRKDQPNPIVPNELKFLVQLLIFLVQDHYAWNASLGNGDGRVRVIFRYIRVFNFPPGSKAYQVRLERTQSQHVLYGVSSIVPLRTRVVPVRTISKDSMAAPQGLSEVMLVVCRGISTEVWL